MKTNIKLLENTSKYRKTKKGVLTNIYHKQIERSKLRKIPMPSYTLEQLQSKFINDKKFNRIFIEWVKSNYNKQFKPSLDRINCLKPYSLDNIQILTWAENRYKQRMELKIIRGKSVLMVMGNKIIAKYKSVTDAVRKTGLSQGNISSCLHGKRITCGGYKFIYENSELLKQEDKK